MSISYPNPEQQELVRLDDVAQAYATVLIDIARQRKRTRGLRARQDLTLLIDSLNALAKGARAEYDAHRKQHFPFAIKA